MDCTSRDRSQVVETVQFSQRLRQVGFHRHFILSQDCYQTGGPNRPVETLTTIEFYMSGPAAPGNGPEPPHGPVGFTYSPDTPLSIGQNLQGTDDDGIVDHFTIDWGDGSDVESVSAELQQGTPPCDPDSEYIATFGSGQSQHTYSAAGTYVLTLSIFSVDCSGGTEQQATVTETVTVPAPPQQSSSS